MEQGELRHYRAALGSQESARPYLNPSLLSSEQEVDYQQNFLYNEKILVTQKSTILAVVLYSLFGILDYWAIPSSLFVVWAIRATVVVLSLTIHQVAQRRPSSMVRYYNYVMAFLLLAWASGIEIMILFSQRVDVARITYYAGLILVAIAIYTWTYIPIRPAVMIGGMVIAVYIAISVFVHKMLDSEYWIVLVANSFFLTSANIIGVFAMNTRERFSRQTYQLTQSLNENIQQINAAKRKSDYLAEHDVLTGLLNRAGFMRQVEGLLTSVRLKGQILIVFYLDLDRFKEINDTYGHSIGDMALAQVASRIQARIRSSDIVGRFGGDEFVIAVQIPKYDPGLIHRIAQEIADEMAKPVIHQSHLLDVRASIGTAVYPLQADNIEALLSIADKQMYRMKNRESYRSEKNTPSV